MIQNIKIAKGLIKLAKELIQEKELTLYMIVGISGSGKSTFAKSLSNN
jgi:ABC-type bacteriocin/lantibiotic exporter with double-glycine peptidase domain